MKSITRERGKLTDRLISILKKVSKENEENAIYLFSQTFSSENLFHSIFRDSCLKGEAILKLLDDSATDTLYENASFYAKSKDEKAAELFCKILPHLVRLGKN